MKVVRDVTLRDLSHHHLTFHLDRTIISIVSSRGSYGN
jgi:hypothetical protein